MMKDPRSHLLGFEILPIFKVQRIANLKRRQAFYGNVNENIDSEFKSNFC